MEKAVEEELAGVVQVDVEDDEGGSAAAVSPVREVVVRVLQD